MLQWSWSDRTIALDPAQPVPALGVRSPQALEPLPGLGVDAIADPARLALPVLDSFESRRELTRADLRHLLPRRSPDGGVRRDQADALTVPVLGGEAFEQRVRVRREAHFEGAVPLIRPDPVEDDYASRSPNGDVAGEVVDELLALP